MRRWLHRAAWACVRPLRAVAAGGRRLRDVLAIDHIVVEVHAQRGRRSGATRGSAARRRLHLYRTGAETAEGDEAWTIVAGESVIGDVGAISERECPAPRIVATTPVESDE